MLTRSSARLLAAPLTVSFCVALLACSSAESGAEQGQAAPDDETQALAIDGVNRHCDSVLVAAYNLPQNSQAEIYVRAAARIGARLYYEGKLRDQCSMVRQSFDPVINDSLQTVCNAWFDKSVRECVPTCDGDTLGGRCAGGSDATSNAGEAFVCTNPGTRTATNHLSKAGVAGSQWTSCNSYTDATRPGCCPK
jgi:hypothetical protein